MITRKKLVNEIQDLVALEGMIIAYEEIAANRMRRIKNSVLRNREFLNGLTDIFAAVKNSYKEEVERLLQENKKRNKGLAKASLIVKKERTVVVLLSASSGLYGDIIKRTFDEFAQYVTTNDVDIVIIGKLGKRLAGTLGKDFTYFELSDSAQDPEGVVKILEFLSQYEHILVFHGKFKDILNQLPARTYITGEDLSAKIAVQAKVVKSIFEPSLEQLLVFFETQILSALFDQTLYESSLSKFTSRMISLDQAAVNIHGRLDDTKLRSKKFKHIAYNKSQSNMLAGLVLWS